MNEPKSGLGAIIPPRTYNVELNLYEALKGVPSVSELSKKFGDSGDIIKSRRRQLIAAALDAIFYSKIFLSDEYEEAEPGHSFSLLLSELIYARRDFIHDCERLDNAIGAELILAPAGKDSTLKQNVIKADRKILIEALAAIELGKEHSNPEFKKISARIKILEKFTGYSSASLVKYRKQMEQSIKIFKNTKNKSKAEFNKKECDFYIYLLKTFTDLSTETDHAMDLLLPAVSGHKLHRVPKSTSKADSENN